MMENEKPFFSIVIPTYNHGHLIKRCLDSIVAQTYIHWEAIVVNNYSNDNTVEIVESYRDPRIRLVNNANHGIIAVSRNKGIELKEIGSVFWIQTIGGPVINWKPVSLFLLIMI